MNVEKQIQIAVEQADLFICETMKNLGIIAILTIVLLVCVYGFRNYMYAYHDPYWIDYDKPGVDITSEGDD